MHKLPTSNLLPLSSTCPCFRITKTFALRRERWREEFSKLEWKQFGTIHEAVNRVPLPTSPKSHYKVPSPTALHLQFPREWNSKQSLLGWLPNYSVKRRKVWISPAIYYLHSVVKMIRKFCMTRKRMISEKEFRTFQVLTTAFVILKQWSTHLFLHKRISPIRIKTPFHSPDQFQTTQMQPRVESRGLPVHELLSCPYFFWNWSGWYEQKNSYSESRIVWRNLKFPGKRFCA